MGAGKGKSRRMQAVTHPRPVLISKSSGNLTEDEFRRCRKLTLNQEGVMSSNLYCSRREKRGDVALVQDPRTGQLLGWGLLAPPRKGYKRPEINVYVRANQRQKGIGKLVLEELLKLSEPYKPYKPAVFPWDLASELFYGAYEKKLALQYPYGYQRQGQPLPDRVSALQIRRLGQSVKIQWRRGTYPPNYRAVISVDVNGAPRFTSRLPASQYTLRIRSEERRVGKECRSRW